MIYIILITYMVFTFWGSLIGVKDKNDTPEGYFLANRGLTTLALFFTILATNFSAFYFLGFAGEGYRIGYAYYPIIAFGTSLAGLSIYVIGMKVWQLGKTQGYITPAELIYGQTKSLPLRYIYAFVMVIYTLPYLALQIVGGGYILENLTNGDIPYSLAIVLLTVFTIAYVLIGGMTSVAKTDLKQGVIMIVFMIMAVIFISIDLGGLALANQQVFEIKPELFSIAGYENYYTPQKWLSYMFFWMFCIPMFPQLFMRFYIAKEPAHLKKTVLLYALVPIFLSLMPVIIGVLGHLSFPELTGKGADQLFPKMLMKHTHEWFAALIMTGAIAAFMSTLDSQLLALSTIVTRDFYLPLTGKKIDFKKEVFVGRIFVVLFAVLGLLIAINPFATIFDMGKLAFAGYAILFPVTIAITNYGGVKPSFGIASILIGQFLLVGFYYKLFPSSILMGFEPFIPILALCFLIVFIGNRLEIKHGKLKKS